MTELPPFKAVAMRDAVASALRAALFDRRFQPGQPIVESAIAAEMKVSRGPVREALLLLTQEGLVTHSQNRGFAVLNFTEADHAAASQVRYPLETTALQLARLHQTPADILQLERIKRRMLENFRAGDARARLQDELDFHNLIWNLSGNAYLVSCLQRVTIPAFTYGAAYRMNRPDLTSELFDTQHQFYIDYLKGATTKTAAECVRFHLGLATPEPDTVPLPESSIPSAKPL
ncbi:MAG: GntR family transcriptional regulator [Bryobacterales bacterium]|nr:GntR family transcriptional regulator [Bryobacterales bacterium]